MYFQMKTVNLQSIISAKENLDEELFSLYLNYSGNSFANKKAGKGIRGSELDDLSIFVENLKNEDREAKLLNDYYIGYCIPQIGKEFDLLRLGKDHIINIELKKTSNEERITKQLIRNSYYLKFSKRAVYLFTYVVDENKLYKLDADKIVEVDFSELIDRLKLQTKMENNNIDDLFDPKYYLISPFNSTDEFLNSNYFLTEQQEEIKNQIKKLIDNNSGLFISLTGAAGTGKTLLTYDIAKDYLTKILHCAQLNEGQQELKSEYNWEISSTKYGIDEDFSYYELIILDEAQRALPDQIKRLKQKIQESNANCIFSYDKKQCLSNKELDNDVTKYIEKLSDKKTFKLTQKIRTNKEIANFIDLLFDKNKKAELSFKSNIKICYFKDSKEALPLLINLHDDGWHVPNYTPGKTKPFFYERYKILEEDCAHSIIGQEYDNVVAVIDNNFEYNNDGIIISIRNSFYSQKQMLFQIMTRARKKLYLVIINNEIILNRCLEILIPEHKN